MQHYTLTLSVRDLTADSAPNVAVSHFETLTDATDALVDLVEEFPNVWTGLTTSDARDLDRHVTPLLAACYRRPMAEGVRNQAKITIPSRYEINIEIKRQRDVALQSA